MPRNQDKACLHFELDPRGCGLCTEPQNQHQHQHQHQPQPKPDSRGSREEREHNHKKHTRHHSGLRSESPPIAIRARTRPPPVERHTAKHRAPSKTRARSPVVPAVYLQQEEVPITHGRRSNRVRRRETAPAHLEEATAPRRYNSLCRDEDPMAPGGHALPYNAQFEGWVPDGQRKMNFFTEQVPAPSPPKHIWTSEHNDDPAAPLNWVPLSVEIPPPPPPRRRYTSDSARHADPFPPEGWYVDGAAPEPSVRDTRHNHPHRNRNFSSAAETERPAARESRRRGHNQPSIDSSAREDAHRKRGHAQDRDEQRTHYSVRFEYVYPTPEGSTGGWYQHEDVTHAHTAHYHTTHEAHYHADPYSSGTTYNNEPQSFHTYTEGESYERSSYPHPSTSHRDHREHHRSGRKHRHDYPPHDAAEAVPPVKDLSEHWTVLGLQEGADDAAIRSAYKKMALKCHPDRQVGKDEREKKRMEELFLKVKAAHDTLLKK
ncbi:hypothetical protein DFP73DRAFT_524786 [Morchella snyderi]|nr:hypothetical protein DFP73DRAFT_524786 [Morchella snyderi]